MKTLKLNLILLFIILGSGVNAQDSTAKKKIKVIPERRQEVGISILTPLIILTGADDSHSDRFSYATYRYRLTEHNSIKGAVGITGFAGGYARSNSAPVVSSSQNNIYLNTDRKTPSNFQVCFGYERMWGKRKLKQMLGVDLLYNNYFMVEHYYYTEAYEQTYPNGGKSTEYRNIDTGSYRRSYNYDRFGFNLSYSLRYEMSKRFVLTASAIGSFKYSVLRNTLYGNIYNFDFNMPGLIADVSLFYRFKK